MPDVRSTAPFFSLSVIGTPDSDTSLVTTSSMEAPDASPRSQLLLFERAIFGYRIPYLPSFITSPHLSGATEQEKLVEVLVRQTQIVANLHKWNGTTFALRYLVQPKRGEVQICLLVRLRGEIGRAAQMGEQVSKDMTATFRSLNIPLEPITESSELGHYLAPLPPSIVLQLTQKEDMVRLRTNNSLAYVVYPFRRPPTSWIHVLETMLGQDTPCLISVHLEPTQLFDSERQVFAEVGGLAENLADYRFFSLGGQYHLPDPQARAVAQLHSDYSHRLITPVLLAVYVASPAEGTAYAVAHDLGAEITENAGIESMLREGEHLPCGFDLTVPGTEAELQVAWRNITQLEIGEWGRNVVPERHIPREQIPPNKRRLRYLADVKAASSAFRFPIAVQGGLPGVKTKQIVPAFYNGARPANISAGELLIGNHTDRPGVIGVPIAALNRHLLVAGTTGSGKTTTCMHLLSQLWEKGIPFLVIEPAKNEYRTLLKSLIGSSIQIFTLGDESVSPFRLNPLEIVPGVRVETHISYLRACFEAVIPTFGILPSLIEESLHKVYVEKGWNLSDRGQTNETRLMPTLGELYFEIVLAAEGRGYSQKTLQDIRAAAAGRIGSLLRGSKGRMLNTQHSIPIEYLMKRPTILELEALNVEEKALVMLFLLTAIREYCKVTRSESRLQHVTLIEEAHRIMATTPHNTNREVLADTRAEAAAMLGSTLSEVRAFGEGLIVAEQIPSRLEEDALKNTNIKIIHKLPGEDDRRIVGGTMNLDSTQQMYVSKLDAGRAAYFTEGFEKPTFVSIPNYKVLNNLPERVNDHEVQNHMAAFRNEHQERLLAFDGCRFCQKPCQYRDRITLVVYDVESGQHFREAMWEFEKRVSQGNPTAGWAEVVKKCQGAVASAGLGRDEHAAFCYFVHLWRHAFSWSMASTFRKSICLNDRESR